MQCLCIVTKPDKQVKKKLLENKHQTTKESSFPTVCRYSGSYWIFFKMGELHWQETMQLVDLAIK